ncbi:hypothetical protein [Actibacterium pelagium]|uniref:Uncharacterized protein n=1 Tax=Actibacterium pelagium TaxID=2029103 RepID=A0A917ANW7_9RHOB|nr:hypothetical protein [Actibacterium pelagium]GGE62876.1 hypothetical protein GCM10011517_33250 [Actibacterium pelagium]
MPTEKNLEKYRKLGLVALATATIASEASACVDMSGAERAERVGALMAMGGGVVNTPSGFISTTEAIAVLLSGVASGSGVSAELCSREFYSFVGSEA